MSTITEIKNNERNVIKDSVFNLDPGAHECWFPIALSARVPQGKVLGRDIADGRVVVYRGEDGVARVMSGYCKHMGADLSVGGEVLGNDIRCPYHHWSYGDGGQCTTIPSGDNIPKRAKLFHFPTKEQFGLIWMFYGEKPRYELQTFEDFNDNEYVVRSYELDTPKLVCEPWIFLTNIYDIVHLKFLHKINIVNSEIETIDNYRRRMSWDAELGDRVTGGWRPEIDVYGMNSIRTKGDQGGRLKWYIAALLPAGREGTKFFVTIATTKGEGDVEFLDQQAAMHTTLVSEDIPILNNMRYGDLMLVPSDRAMSSFLRSVLKYPRTTMEALEKSAKMA